MMRDRIAALQRRRRQAQAPAAQPIDIPLPLRGLFVQAKTASVSNMYASDLLNFRSNGVSIQLRPSEVWQGRATSDVIQRIPYEFGGQSIYIELSPTKAVAGSDKITRAFNGRAAWGTNSSNVVIADGLGQPMRFDGSVFAQAEFTAVSGPHPEDCDGILFHHDRPYLWKSDGALEFLYGDVGAVGGPLSVFPLGRLGNITGGIKTMVSLTVDAGNGVNDWLCIITTTGQLIIYQGFDPSDSSDWQLVARIDGAVPVGARAFCQVGADAWMLTPQGVVSIREAIQTSVLALVSEFTQPIKDEIVTLIEEGPADWQMLTAKDGSFVVVSRVKDGVAQQYIYDIASRSWAPADYAARDWHNLAGKPEITGFDGRLGKLRIGGSERAFTGRWVSSWFEVGRARAVNYLEPTIIAEGPLEVRVVVLSDRQDRPADIAEAEQTFYLEPEEGGGNRVTLSDIIPVDASGTTFQITLEVTARWAEITGLKAGLS